jgi:hypothetical protein
MLNRLRQWFAPRPAPQRTLTIYPDGTFSVNHLVMDAAVEAQSGAYRPQPRRRSSRQVTIDVGEDKIVTIR